MDAIASDVVGGFNSFLAEQRRQPGECRLTLVQFDDQYEVLYAGVPLADVRRLTARTYQPRGSTALLDAVGRTIDAAGRRFSELPEPTRPDRVLMVIVTDGLENASTDFDAAGRLSLVVPVSRCEPGCHRGRGQARHRRAAVDGFRCDRCGRSGGDAEGIACCFSVSHDSDGYGGEHREGTEEGALSVRTGCENRRITAPVMSRRGARITPTCE